MKILVIAALLLSTMPVLSQTLKSEKQSPFSKKLKAKLLQSMPDWQYRSVEPIEGSSNVSIDIWEVNDLAVRVAVTDYDSEEGAKTALDLFEKDLREKEAKARSRGKNNASYVKEELPSQCDRYLSWKTEGSDSEAVALRRGKFLVFVNVVRPTPNIDSFLSKQFARQVLDVLESQ